MFRFGLWLATAASAILFAAGASAWTETPSREDVRRAVNASLPLLQQSADTWFAKRECASCHHQGLGQMTVAVARERGYAFDEALLRAQLEKTLRPVPGWHERYILGEASINEAIGQSYRLVGLGTAGGTPTPLTSAVAHLLAGRQHVSGQWPSYSHRPPLEDTAFTATALTVRALRLFPLSGREVEIDARIARARRWLAAAAPASTEDRVMQILGLAWAGDDPADLGRRRGALVAQQRPDGGWAQISARESDAYATGQVLVALNQAARLPVSDPVYRRGIAFLVRSQASDGSWRVETRRAFNEGLPYFETGYPHGKDQFISYAGAAWATMALMLAEADAVSPALMGRPPAWLPASPPVPGDDGLTALMRAGLYGSAADLDRLIAAGADVNAASPLGVTALMAAVRDPEKVRRLLAAGADAAAATPSGHDVLAVAAAYDGAAGSVSQILARRVPCDRPTPKSTMRGATPLGRAVLRGDREVAAALLACGARVDGPAGALPPIFAVVFQDDAVMVEWLAERGADVNLREPENQSTPLMVAAEEGKLDVVRALLRHGAHVDLADAAGYTPLMYLGLAPARDDEELARVLIAAGARQGRLGPDGATAAGYARRYGKASLAAVLEAPE